MNRIIDNPQRETAIDKYIADVLLQNSKLKEAYESFNLKMLQIRGEIFTCITIYEELMKRLKDTNEEITKIGSLSSFIKTIEELE